MVKIYKKDESFLFIDCELDTAQDLKEYFSFYTTNYYFSKKYKAGLWSGKFYLYDMRTSTLPIGLLEYLLKFFKTNRTKYKIEKSLLEKGRKLNSNSIIKFSKNLLKTEHTPRDYQIKAIQYMLYYKRCIILSATASGKSFIAFLIFNIIKYFNPDYKFLLVVPSTNLVEQMAGDFIEYGENFTNYNKYIHKIYSGKEKSIDKPITISTWQSLQNLPDKYFRKFDVILGDEAHGCNAAELSRIIEACVNAKFKWGMSGTLQDTQVSKVQLQGLFGKVFDVARAKKLINKGWLSKLKIKGIILEYDKATRKKYRKEEYRDELELIRSRKDRLKYILQLTITRKQNTLVLFNDVKGEYGKTIYKLCKKYNKHTFYIDGSVDTEVREKIRKFAENHNDVIIIASFRTFATGINIKNLHNIIFAETMNSVIKVLQAIGRVLRLHELKNYATLYDITDHISIRGKNYVLQHFFNRISYYEKEGYDYDIKTIKLK